MDFTIPTAALTRELALAQRAVSRKPTIPALAGVRITAADDGVTCVATDLEIAVRANVAADVADRGSIVAPAQKLYDLVRTLSDERVRLSSSGATLAVRGSAFNARLQVHPLDDFPTVQDAPAASTPLGRAALLDLIRRVRFAVTEDDKRYYLAGARMEVHEERLRFVATDAHRLAVAEAAKAPGPKLAPALLPRKTLDALASLLEETDEADVFFAAGENHLFFTVGSRVLVSRTIDGKYPEYARIIPPPRDQRAEVPRAELERAMRRSAMVADPGSRKVVVALSSGAIRLTARSADVGDADEAVGAAFAGPDVQFALNAGYVLDFLDAAGTEAVTVEAQDDKHAVVWRGVGGDVDYTYVAMPVIM